MNKDLITAVESGDIFLLYRRNLRYLKGKSRWTLQGKHLVYKLIATAVVGIVVAGTIIGFTPDSSDPLILILASAIFFPLFMLWTAYKIKKERMLARDGRLIRGRIASCEWTMGGSDVDRFKIDFVFEGNESSFKTTLDKDLAKTLPGREVIVLFLDTGNMLVL